MKWRNSECYQYTERRIGKCVRVSLTQSDRSSNIELQETEHIGSDWLLEGVGNSWTTTTVMFWA